MNKEFTIDINNIVYATGAGDPYIVPVYGNQYKLPDKEACYRLFERGDVYINGIVKQASNEKKQEIKNYVQSIYDQLSGSLLSLIHI